MATRKLAIMILAGTIWIGLPGTFAWAANLTTLFPSAPIKEAYKAATWKFFASSNLPSGGFYFWKDTQGDYHFQYIQLNTRTASMNYAQCHKGATGTLTPEASARLLTLVAKIRAFKQKEPVQKPPRGRKSLIRTLTFREHSEGQAASFKFYYKGDPDPLFNAFYNFANGFRGEMTSPCPSW